jgi:hypothetical protein
MGRDNFAGTQPCCACAIEADVESAIVAGFTIESSLSLTFSAGPVRATVDLDLFPLRACPCAKEEL